MARLLLIEDDPTLLLSLRLALTAQGHEVHTANSLEKGRAQLSQGTDLVLLDLGLPDGDGLSLVHEMRARSDKTPILAVTARATLSDRVDGLRSGADDYVTKPFDLPELIARIEALLRRRGWSDPPGASRAKFGRLEVDFETRESTCDGEAVSLSDLEYRFLRYLLEHTGKVVTREELLTRVWNLPAQSRTRSLDTFVYRLRRIIEVDPAAPAILTSVRGTGWRLMRPG